MNEVENVIKYYTLCNTLKSLVRTGWQKWNVILMLSVHELEEIIIGDFTPFQISKEEKENLGHEAIDKVLDCLLDKEQIRSLILEFDERKTEAAKFAYYINI